MYGLPENFDASVFAGRTLEMLCFSLNQVCLHFDNHTKITAEGTLTYQTPSDKGAPQKITPPVSSTNLMGLLEHKIVAASARADGTLSLAFDNGHIVELLDLSPNYESYRMTFNGKTFVV